MLPHPFNPLETVIEEHPNVEEENNTLRRDSSFVYRRRQDDDESSSLKNIEAVVIAQTADNIPCLSPLDSDSWEDFDYRDELVDNNTEKIMENLSLADHEDSPSKRGRTSSTNALLEEYHTLFAMGESLSHPLSSNGDQNTSTDDEANEASMKQKQKKKSCKRHRRRSTHFDFDQVLQSL